MAKRMRISVSIEDENGEIIVTKTNEREVPYIKEIETVSHMVENKGKVIYNSGT